MRTAQAINAQTIAPQPIRVDRACGKGWSGTVGQCKRAKAKDLAVHGGEMVAAWAVGKVAGGAIAQLAVAHGVPHEVSKIVGESSVQALAAVAIHAATHKSNARRLAGVFVAQAAAAAAGKIAHGEVGGLTAGANPTVHSLSSLAAGKASGLGTVTAMGEHGQVLSGLIKRIRGRADAVDGQRLTKEELQTLMELGLMGVVMAAKIRTQKLQPRRRSDSRPCKDPWKGTLGSCVRSTSQSGSSQGMQKIDRTKYERISKAMNAVMDGIDADKVLSDDEQKIKIQKQKQYTKDFDNEKISAEQHEELYEKAETDHPFRPNNEQLKFKRSLQNLPDGWGEDLLKTAYHSLSSTKREAERAKKYLDMLDLYGISDPDTEEYNPDYIFSQILKENAELPKIKGINHLKERLLLSKNPQKTLDRLKEARNSRSGIYYSKDKAIQGFLSVMDHGDDFGDRIAAFNQDSPNDAMRTIAIAEIASNKNFRKVASNIYDEDKGTYRIGSWMADGIYQELNWDSVKNDAARRRRKCGCECNCDDCKDARKDALEALFVLGSKAKPFRRITEKELKKKNDTAMDYFWSNLKEPRADAHAGAFSTHADKAPGKPRRRTSNHDCECDKCDKARKDALEALLKLDAKKAGTVCNAERGWAGMKKPEGQGCKRAKPGTAARVRRIERKRQGKSPDPPKARTITAAEKAERRGQLRLFPEMEVGKTAKPRRAQKNAAKRMSQGPTLRVVEGSQSGKGLEQLFQEADRIGRKYQEESDPISLSAKRAANDIVDKATGRATRKATGVVDLDPRRRKNLTDEFDAKIKAVRAIKDPDERAKAARELSIEAEKLESRWGRDSGLSSIRKKTANLSREMFRRTKAPQPKRANKPIRINKKQGEATQFRPPWGGSFSIDSKDHADSEGVLISSLPRRNGKVKYRGQWWTINKDVPATQKGKKRQVIAKKGDRVKLISFGAEGYRHNYSPKAKANYLSRSGGIRNKQGQLTKEDPWSPNYWSRKVLWPKNDATPCDADSGFSGTTKASGGSGCTRKSTESKATRGKATSPDQISKISTFAAKNKLGVDEVKTGLKKTKGYEDFSDNELDSIARKAVGKQTSKLEIDEITELKSVLKKGEIYASELIDPEIISLSDLRERKKEYDSNAKELKSLNDGTASESLAVDDYDLKAVRGKDGSIAKWVDEDGDEPMIDDLTQDDWERYSGQHELLLTVRDKLGLERKGSKSEQIINELNEDLGFLIFPKTDHFEVINMTDIDYLADVYLDATPCSRKAGYVGTTKASGGRGCVRKKQRQRVIAGNKQSDKRRKKAGKTTPEETRPKMTKIQKEAARTAAREGLPTKAQMGNQEFMEAYTRATQMRTQSSQEAFQRGTRKRKINSRVKSLALDTVNRISEGQRPRKQRSLIGQDVVDGATAGFRGKKAKSNASQAYRMAYREGDLARKSAR